MSVCSNLKEQWKVNRGVLLPDSVVHHGRALLNYQGGDERSDIDKPLVFGNVDHGHDKQSVTKETDTSMLITSRRKPLPFKGKSTQRKDLMVVKNKWDLLGDSKHIPRNSKRKGKRSKSRGKIKRKETNNSTLDEQYYCPSSFNKTEVNR